ncbi:hypothetical protein F9288_08970 [Sphingomonas sp. CL5.1]|uniref:hypothetical protein n=1 Tax=Sphingomonas sp. CL5.1 TaxID=2653203 RepID=UPI0015837363|nr:hypothetical protein [Sphingomonas sp. CL5.1]QKR99753.1 hypothetical protein F9288_08970 [Sphingomonas sp. CL5.1]
MKEIRRAVSAAFVPGRGLIALRIDDQDNSSRFCRDPQAPPASRKQELPTETMPVQILVRGEPGKQEAFDVMARPDLGYNCRNAAIADRGRREAVEPQHPVRMKIVDRAECLGAARLVILPRVPGEERVQAGVATIEVLPVVRFRDRLLVPFWKGHQEWDRAAAAARNLLLGAGGLSRRSSTRSSVSQYRSLTCRL